MHVASSQHASIALWQLDAMHWPHAVSAWAKPHVVVKTSPVGDESTSRMQPPHPTTRSTPATRPAMRMSPLLPAPETFVDPVDEPGAV